MKPNLTEPEAGPEQSGPVAATPMMKKWNLPGVTGRAEVGQSGRRRGPWPARRARLRVCWLPRLATELGRVGREAVLGRWRGASGVEVGAGEPCWAQGGGGGRRAAPGSGGNGYGTSVVERMGQRRGVRQRWWTRAKKRKREEEKRGGKLLGMRLILCVGPTYEMVHFTVAGGALLEIVSR
jgi:hypothetical protein